MGKKDNQKQLTEPWRNIHGAIWLIGLAILFWKGWFWPGILVLIALSTILEVVVMKMVPGSYQVGSSEENDNGVPKPLESTRKDPDPVTHPELLPSSCPKCGAPVRAHEVKWTSEYSADCIFCGGNLPFKNK